MYQPIALLTRRVALALLCGLTLGLAACGSAPAATSAPPTSASAGAGQLNVAMIAPNRVFDKGYMELSWKGVEQAEQDFGAKTKVLEVLDASLVMKNVDELVSQGYNVIVMVSPQLRDLTIEAAKKHPTIIFIGVDHPQDDPPLPNLTGLIFREDQAGYLAGALASSMSQTGKVGAVLGTDAVPQLYAFGEGFRKGAEDTKPGIQVTLVYHNEVSIEKSFIDPEWGRLQASAMLDAGVDVIFAAAGATGNGALAALAERKDQGVMGIGVDTDQYFTVPEAQPILLSSTMKQVDKGILTLIGKVKDGTIQGGNFYGSIGLAPFHDFEAKIPAEVKQRLADLQRRLESGELKIELPPQTKN